MDCLAGKYIWIDVNGTPELRPVTAGKTHDNQVEITSGLSASDKIIVDPNISSAEISITMKKLFSQLKTALS